MKKKILHFFLPAILLLYTNLAKAQGGTLNPNNTISGTITTYKTDKWDLTTTADGQLQITLGVSGSTDLLATLYDNDGVTILAGASEAFGTQLATLNEDGLAPGTYHILIIPYSTSGGFGSYTLSNTFTAATIGNDQEPNGSAATAITLPLNGTKTGHVGYYYNNRRDTTDWYKVTTNADGLLKVDLTTARGSTLSSNPLDVNVTLFDNDATTQLGAVEVFNGNSPATNSIVADGLAPGTYYIKIQPYSTTEFANYTISNALTAAGLPNDAEPNATAAGAIGLPLNGTKTGHVGYYYNNQRDTTDWYKVTTNADGLLKLDLTTARGNSVSVNTLDVDVTLYDNDGMTQLGAVEVYNGGGPGTNSIVTDGLAPGTYYVKIQSYSTSEFANYTVSNTLTASVLANDAEPNGKAATAISLPINGSSTGHVGYYYNNQRDTTDWYKVTTTGNGLLQLTLSTVRGNASGTNPLDVNVTLYDNDAVTQLGAVEVFNGNGPGTNNILADGLAPGTYYVKIQNYSTSEFANYTLSDSFVPTALTGDPEPNGGPATAVNLPLNSSKTGNVGYYYNAKRDTADWYKVTTGTDGLLRVYLSTIRGSDLSTNGLDVIVTLYDNNATTALGSVEVFSGYGPASGYITADGLAAGTYYIKVQPYSTSEFANYTITDSLFIPPLAIDAEPNGSESLASSLPGNVSVTGHVGYYYNNQRDTADWFKLATNATGPISLTLSTARGSVYSNNSLDVNLWLYAPDGTTQLGFVEVFNGNGPGTGSIATGDLPAGTYYIKVQSYSTTEFADYTLTNISNAGSVLKVTSAVTNASCFGQAGSVSFNASGGTAPYTYYLVNTLNGAAQNNSTGLFTGLSAGNYYDSVVDAGKQYVTGSITITQPAQIILPPIVVSGSTTVCSGATISLTDAVPGGVWSSSDPLLASVSPGGVVSFGTSMATAQVTIHYVVVNSVSCSSSTSVTFIVNPPLTAGSISGNTMLCVGKSVTLTDPVTGGIWSSSSSNATVNPNTGQVTGVNPGTASILYTINSGGCTATASTIITVNASPVAGAISGNPVLFRGATTVWTDATPGGVWSSSNSSVATVSAVGMVKGISSGTCAIYYIVTNAGGCSDTASKQITVYGVPAVQTSFDKIICFGGSTVLTVTVSGGSGSYRYSLYGRGFQSSNLFTVSAGIYFVLVQDNISKLWGYTLVFIGEPFPLGLYTVNQTNAGNGLSDGSFTVTGYGGHSPYVYSIDNGVTYQSSGSFNNLAEATYYVSIQDASGCTRLHAARVVILGKHGHWKDDDDFTGGGLTAHVFPNPAQSYFTLTIDADNPKTVDIEVVDLLGHVVYHTKGNTSDTFRFGQDFGKGTYFIRIISDRESKVIKAIKQ